MAMTGEKPTEKGRLIARLATLLIRYAHPLSVLSCLVGLISLILLPLLAKNTYISENALIPGSSNARYSTQEAKEANDLAKEILSLKLSSMQNPVAIQNLLMQHMYDAAGDLYFHKFLPPVNTFEPSSFFIDSSYSKKREFNSINSSTLGVNVVGIIRAPRGDGKEAIVLVTPFCSDNVDVGDALSLGLGFSLFLMFSRTIWLAKDIVWLAADSKYGAHAALAAWLKDYHEPEFYYSSAFMKSSSHINNQNPAEKGKLTFEQIRKADDFKRAGTIAAGLVFQVKEAKIKLDKDRLDVYAEGCNGQMPNLDLINVVNFLAVHRQGLQVRVDLISHMLRWKWLALLGEILEWLGNLVGRLNPGWKFGLPAFEYLHGAATLASSIYRQALGVSTGAHGAFRDYQVDAITIEMSPHISLENEISRMSFLVKIGRLLEAVVRSVNNLLEKFHQSFFLYFLTSSSRFVSVGVYMIPFALLIVPLMILAASFCSHNHDSLSTTFSKSEVKSGPPDHPESEVTDINASESATSNYFASGQDLNINLGLNLQSHQWFVATKVVLLVYLWASVVAMLPYVIYRFSIQASEMKLLIWAVLSCVTLLLGNSILGSPYTRIGMQNDAVNPHHMEGWVPLKAFTLGATTIGLGIMSIINCAAALLGAIVLVPMCLSVYPYKYYVKAGNIRKSFLILLSTIFFLLAFPPFTMLALKALFDDFSKVSIVDFWNWMEILWSSQSATYIYLFLVHVPCWVLCSYVLLYK